MPTSPTLRILLIEDNAGDAGLIRRALMQAGCPLSHIDWVATLAEGRARALAHGYDAVLLDLSLPDSAGMATVTSLRGSAPRLPIVVLTGHDDMDFALQALDAGAQDYLVKGDAEGHDLIRSIRYARERFELERQLATSRERFRSFAEAGSDWLWETDVDNRFTFLSEVYEKITGIPPQTVLGRRREDLFSLDIAPAELIAYGEALEKRQPFKNFEYPLIDLQGELRYFRVSGTPVFEAGQFSGYRGVGTDVTRFKTLGLELRDRVNELEYSRRQMEEQATQMAQLAEETAVLKDKAEAAARAKAEFLATMSHEIRTPMTGVLGMVELLRQQPLDERQRQYVDIIKEAGETLITILNDILDISKLEAGRFQLAPEPTDIRTVAHSVCQLFQGRAGDRGNRLELRIAPEVPARVQADGHRLRQVLFNLVGNAVKFTEGGTVALDITTERNGSTQRLRFAISDTGIGIPPDRLDRLFTRYEQADGATARHYGGTGLGLALCKSIAELMGGSIAVSSQLGQGSCFTVVVPVEVLADQEPAEAAAAPAAAAQAAGLRLLVAEDNRINQMLLREILGKLGEVALAGNGREAVDAFAAGHFDLVVMDVRMPVMGGLEAIRLIRDTPAGATVPILTLSADVLPENMAECAAAGADASLGKPIDMRALVTTVLRLVQQRRESQAQGTPST